ncbi:hypothetical protein [Paenibacillus sp. NPDC058071]|uniref:hypothetical protein n=1 Tax=Paenibacillus sp. NPDC058071 TaxID=3346326 RepID=UPI0036D83FC6
MNSMWIWMKSKLGLSIMISMAVIIASISVVMIMSRDNGSSIQPTISKTNMDNKQNPQPVPVSSTALPLEEDVPLTEQHVGEWINEAVWTGYHLSPTEEGEVSIKFDHTADYASVRRKLNIGNANQLMLQFVNLNQSITHMELYLRGDKKQFIEDSNGGYWLYHEAFVGSYKAGASQKGTIQLTYDISAALSELQDNLTDGVQLVMMIESHPNSKASYDRKGSMTVQSVTLTTKANEVRRTAFHENTIMPWSTDGGYKLSVQNGRTLISYDNPTDYANVSAEIKNHSKAYPFLKLVLDRGDRSTENITVKFLGTNGQEGYDFIDLTKHNTDTVVYEVDTRIVNAMIDKLERVELFIDSNPLNEPSNRKGKITIASTSLMKAATQQVAEASVPPPTGKGVTIDAWNTAGGYTIQREDGLTHVSYKNNRLSDYSNIYTTVNNHAKEYGNLTITLDRLDHSAENVLVKLLGANGEEGYGVIDLMDYKESVVKYEMDIYATNPRIDKVVKMELFIDSSPLLPTKDRTGELKIISVSFSKASSQPPKKPQPSDEEMESNEELIGTWKTDGSYTLNPRKDGAIEISYKNIGRNTYENIYSTISGHSAEKKYLKFTMKNLDSTSKHVLIKTIGKNGKEGYGLMVLKPNATTDYEMDVYSANPDIDVISKIELFIDSSSEAGAELNDGKLEIQDVSFTEISKNDNEEEVKELTIGEWKTEGGYKLNAGKDGLIEISYESIGRNTYENVYSTISGHSKEKKYLRFTMKNLDSTSKYVLIKTVGKNGKEGYGLMVLKPNATTDYEMDIYGSNSGIDVISKIELFIDSSGEAGADVNNGKLELLAVAFANNTSLHEEPSPKIDSEQYHPGPVTPNLPAIDLKGWGTDGKFALEANPSGHITVTYSNVAKNSYANIFRSIDNHTAAKKYLQFSIRNKEHSSKHILVKLIGANNQEGYDVITLEPDALTEHEIDVYATNSNIDILKRIELFIDSSGDAKADTNAGSLVIESYELAEVSNTLPPVVQPGLNLGDWATLGGYTISNGENGSARVSYGNIEKNTYANIYSTITGHSEKEKYLQLSIHNPDSSSKHILIKLLGANGQEGYGVMLLAPNSITEYELNVYEANLGIDRLKRIELFIDSSGNAMSNTNSGSLEIVSYAISEVSSTPPQVLPLEIPIGNWTTDGGYDISDAGDGLVSISYSNVEKGSYANIQSTVIGHTAEMKNLQLSIRNLDNSSKQVLIKLIGANGEEGYGSMLLLPNVVTNFNEDIYSIQSKLDSVIRIELFIDSSENALSATNNGSLEIVLAQISN